MTNDIKIELAIPGPEELLAGTIAQLGYPGPDAVTRDIKAQIDDGLAACHKLARARVLCRATAFNRLNHKSIEAEKLRLETVNWTRLAARMSGVREICCFAVTLGGAIDGRISQLGKTALLPALMLDAAASVLAELYADQIQGQINHYYQQQGLESSARFSPGYCDWPLKEGQAALIGFLRPQAIGIQTSSTGLMTPRKSVTGAVIAAEQAPEASPCFLCTKECAHRRMPYSPGKRQ